MSQKKTNISTNNVSVTPNGKKLVQARLPFKTLASTPKVGVDSLGTTESRKRKLSTSEDDNRSNKLSKTSAAKENIKKTDEVTVLDMVDVVDLVGNDVVMTDNEQNPDLTKQMKKTTKGVDVDDKDVPLRRSSRKNDSEVPTKVVIKIPSTKKKKLSERQRKVVAVPKINEDENDDDDDDVIPIDSEENSLINDESDPDVILIADDSTIASDGKDSNSTVVRKVADSSTTGSVKQDSDIEAVDSSDIPSNKDENLSPTVNGENSVSPKESTISVAMEADSENVTPVKIDANDSEVIVDEEDNQLSSSSDKSDSEGNDETDVKEQNASVSVGNEQQTSDNNEEAKAGQSKLSTPTSSTVERRTRRTIENTAIMATPKTPAPKNSNNSTALTPKQLQKRLESEQKRLAKEKAKEEKERKIQEAKEERERKLQEAKEEKERKLQEAKEERERKLQEEKEQRQRERDEKERQRKRERDDKEEQKRKEREDKEEQRRKEKEERERKKQAEIDAKTEEKRQKEEERVAKEEAEIKKKRKEAEAFTKFFAKKSNRSTDSDKIDVDDIEVKLNFMPFRVKHDMRLAPIVRRKLSPNRKSKFDSEVLNSTQNYSSTDLYIQSLRDGSHVSEKQGKTWPIEDNNDELMIVDDLDGGTPIEEESSAIQKYRAKFFKFEENRRPPYYGTWQKKSSVISPRKPFVTDQKFFDYEIDSDDEWEDEEPGESLHGSDDEKDKESDDDYDIDNEFFVPHGHLSDEELANNDEIDDDNSPDTQKAKLKIMQKVFSDEMKKKTEKIKPRLIGLIWQNKDGSQPQVCPSVIWEMLQMRSMIFNGPRIAIPIIQAADKTDAFDENGESKKNSAMKKRVKLTDEVVSDLLRLVHGNMNGSEFLSKEFRAFTAQNNKDNDKFQEFSLASIRTKIKELAEWKACPDEGPMMNKYCWYVSMEQRKHYNMESLSIINDWNYILTPKTKTKTESKKVKESDKGKCPPEASDELPSSLAKTPTTKSKLGNIAKFTKVLSDDEKKKNFSFPAQEPIEVPSPKPKPADAEPVKKRVKLLMSVPRGQEIPVLTKNSLISQYLSNAKTNNKKPEDADEPICID